MTAYGIYVFVVCFLVGGAVFTFRNRRHRLLSAVNRRAWQLIFAVAVGVSVAVGIIGGVSPPDILAGLIIAPILGFFAKEIGVYLGLGIKYLAKLALRESLKGFKGKKK